MVLNDLFIWYEICGISVCVDWDLILADGKALYQDQQL